jgi:hypothetical protein
MYIKLKCYCWETVCSVLRKYNYGRKCHDLFKALYNLGFEVLTAVKMSITVLWVLWRWSHFIPEGGSDALLRNVDNHLKVCMASHPSIPQSILQIDICLGELRNTTKNFLWGCQVARPRIKPLTFLKGRKLNTTTRCQHAMLEKFQRLFRNKTLAVLIENDNKVG